jgi:hypothetical protein
LYWKSSSPVLRYSSSFLNYPQTLDAGLDRANDKLSQVKFRKYSRCFGQVEGTVGFSLLNPEENHGFNRKQG